MGRTRSPSRAYGQPRPPAKCRAVSDKTKMTCSLDSGHGENEHLAKGMDDQVLDRWKVTTKR